GDVIVVRPVEGLLTWDRDGVAFTKIGTRIQEDGGRWAMIIDYTPAQSLAALAQACAEHDIVCEGAIPGRAYLAVTNELTDVAVMGKLRAAGLPGKLVQIHPKPAVAKPKPAKRAVRKKARA